ncbi:fimbrial protein [Serratia aquatilis]|uniref:Fimbrial protein n=1 Tax=Serratia aquatilis TaxID=1737515 RepID=A0ABV6EBV8_9GAMM
MNRGCLLNKLLVLCLAVACFSVQAEQAEQGKRGTTFVFYWGYLLDEPQCIFTSQQSAQINFGDVQVSQVDGIKYAMRVDLPVKCRPGAVVYLKHLGTPSTFNNAAVQTNVENFAIELSLLNGSNGNFTPMPIGQRTFYNTNGTDIVNISLQAIPVKKAGAKLDTGSFNGVSTIQFDIP